ncbi:MAG: carboxypeptidase regulatory-like domain-containing protein [Candidatus Solibacter usitatus]|nr:carboxypeptidase regulatory-like domain-containing protein [Candidatus Solibacter usitatus]
MSGTSRLVMRQLPVVLACALVWAQAPAVRAPQAQPQRRMPYVPPDMFRVSGQVTDAETREPIEGASVAVRCMDNRQNIRDVVQKTGQGGSYSYMTFAAVRCRVTVEAEGYVEGIDAIERGPAVLEPRAGGEPHTLDFPLHRVAEILGRVMDADTLKPVAGVTVKAQWSVFDAGKRLLKPASAPATTNAEGRFRAAPVPPGEYFLEVVQKEQEQIEQRWMPPEARAPVSGYARTYWPGGGLLEAAAPMYLVAGARYDAGDIWVRKQPLLRVHGTLADRRCRADSKFRLVLWEKGSGRYLPRVNTVVDCNSRFTVKHLAEGQWVLEARMQSQSSEEADAEMVDLDVKPPKDGAPEMEANLQPLPPLLMVVKARGRTALPPGMLATLAVAGRPFHDAHSFVALDGGERFVLPAPPGEKAELKLSGLPERYAVKEITYNGGSTEEGVFTPNRQAPSQTLEVLLTDKPAVIGGVVKRGGKPLAGALVVLASWPVALRAEWPRTVRAVAGEDGRYAFQALAPGTYRVFAVEFGLRRRLEFPGALLRMIGRAEEFTVGEGEAPGADLKAAEP